MQSIINRKVVTAAILLLGLLSSAKTYAISAAEVTLLAYNEHLKPTMALFNGEVPCHKLDLYQQPNIHLMETVILCKALFLGGIRARYKVEGVPTQARAMRSLSSGVNVIFANSVWRSLDNESVYMSDVLVPRGDYLKGIYTSPTNKKVLGVKTLKNLARYYAVVGNTWHLDRHLLDCFGMAQVYVPGYNEMLKMVDSHRTDYLMHNFTSNPGFRLNEFGVDLVPVPNITVSMPDSLHFFISKKHPAGKIIYAAVNDGLKQLKKDQAVRKGYQSVGFYNEKLVGWKNYQCHIDIK